MKELILVGLGGFIGAIGRYGVSGLVLHNFSQRFPLGTLAVNIIGCLLIGIATGLIEKHHLLSPQVRLLLIPGILGGFTTFSAFGFETFFLLRRGDLFFAGLNILLSIILGLLAVWFGFKITAVKA